MWKIVCALVDYKVGRRLQAALDDDPTQALNVSQETISRCLRAMEKINKIGKWVPHNFNDGQISIAKSLAKYCFNAKRESFLYQILTGDEKWIYFESPKWRKSWLSPSKAGPSTPRPNPFGKKIMLCVWWDQSSIVYYKLLESGKTVNAERYHQQIINLNHALIEKRPVGPKDMAKWLDRKSVV